VEYCHKVAAQLTTAGIRVEVNADDQTVGNKIRQAAKRKVPYVVVLGAKEIESGKLPIRRRGSKDNMMMSINDFIALVQEQTRTKNLSL